MRLWQTERELREEFNKERLQFHKDVMAERRRTDLVNLLWLEASKQVAHLNRALRRANRRLKRQQEIIRELKSAARPAVEPREDIKR